MRSKIFLIVVFLLQSPAIAGSTLKSTGKLPSSKQHVLPKAPPTQAFSSKDNGNKGLSPLKKAIKPGLVSAQEFTVKDSSEILGSISNMESNRLSLGGDRVSHVIRTDTSSYQIKNDPDTGDIFLLPNRKTNKPQNLFISSEQGYTYKLILVPSAVPAQQILLHNPALDRKEETKGESQYYSYLAEKIKQLALQPFSRRAKVLLKKQTATYTVSLLTRIEEGSLVFFKGVVTNTSPHTITVNKNTIRFKGRRALWIASTVLQPKTETQFVIAISKR